MKKRDRRQSGFTMVEAVVAMVMIAATAAGVLLPMVSSMGAQYEASYRTLGAKLASDKLEQMVAAGFGSVDAQVGTEAAGTVKKADGTVFADAVYAKFSRTVSAQAAMVGAVEMRWVTVEVFYDGRPVGKVSGLIGP